MNNLVPAAVSRRQIPTQQSVDKLIQIQPPKFAPISRDPHLIFEKSNRIGKCNRGVPLGDSEEQPGKEWDGRSPAGRQAGRAFLSEEITEGSRALSPRLPGRPRFDPNSLWMVITWEKVPIISTKLSEVQCPCRSPSLGLDTDTHYRQAQRHLHTVYIPLTTFTPQHLNPDLKGILWHFVKYLCLLFYHELEGKINSSSLCVQEGGRVLPSLAQTLEEGADG